MIIQIALGIVLAVLILAFLPHLLALGLVALVGLAVVGLAVLAIDHLEATLAIASVGIVCAVLFYGHKYGRHLLERRCGNIRAEKYMAAIVGVEILLAIAAALIYSGVSYGWSAIIPSLSIIMALGIFLVLMHLISEATSFLAGKARKIWSRRKNPEAPSLPKTDQN